MVVLGCRLKPGVIHVWRLVTDVLRIVTDVLRIVIAVVMNVQIVCCRLNNVVRTETDPLLASNTAPTLHQQRIGVIRGVKKKLVKGIFSLWLDVLRGRYNI